MEKLPPIPMPAKQRWREFRIKYVPPLLFCAGVAMVAWMWGAYVAAPTLQGEVRVTSAQVSSPQTGRLIELRVKPFQQVSQGEVIGMVEPAEARLALSVIGAQIDLLRAQVEPRYTEQRTGLDYGRLRLDLLQQKVDLASARVALQRAERELQRNVGLVDEQLISPNTFDLLETTRDQIRVEVQERERMIGELEMRLANLTEPEALMDSAQMEALEGIEQRLSTLAPEDHLVRLVSPIDGMVAAIHQRENSAVVEGMPVVTITASESDKIIGYLRQPFPVDPYVGMPVEVRARSKNRPVALSQITHVAPSLEPITNALAVLRPGMLVDVALPLEISLPPELNLRPGEIVDLFLRDSE